MPKCPKCGTELNSLLLYEQAEVQYNLGYTTDGQPTFVRLNLIMGEGDQSAECPQCHEELFDDDEKAARWLAGLAEWVPEQALIEVKRVTKGGEPCPSTE